MPTANSRSGAFRAKATTESGVSSSLSTSSSFTKKMGMVAKRSMATPIKKGATLSMPVKLMIAGPNPKLSAKIDV